MWRWRGSRERERRKTTTLRPRRRSKKSGLKTRGEEEEEEEVEEEEQRPSTTPSSLLSPETAPACSSWPLSIQDDQPQQRLLIFRASPRRREAERACGKRAWLVRKENVFLLKSMGSINRSKKSLLLQKSISDERRRRKERELKKEKKKHSASSRLRFHTRVCSPPFLSSF